MTKNQRLIINWIRDRCSASGVIRCSGSEIALEFGFSQQYAARLLKDLLDDGHLEELSKGGGHRASKYRLDPSLATTKRESLATTKKTKKPKSQVQKDSIRKSFLHSSSKGRTEGSIEEPSELRTRVARMHAMLGSAERVRKPVKTSNSPFRRFRQHWDDVDSWGTTDFVCYFSYLYKVKFGEEPHLNWPQECGAARTLLKRLKEKEAFKGFLQISFARCKFKPKGMMSFTYGSFYEEVIDSEVTQEILDDWDDDWVLPWLKEKMVEQAHQRNLEHQRWIGSHADNHDYQRKVRREQKHRFGQFLDRQISDNWSLYSEVGQ